MKNRLKQLRTLHQWSQADLARALGISRQAVNGFESGKFDPSLDMAFKLASLFHVAIEDIFIYEAQSPMQTVVERVKTFFGFEFGFERFTDQAIAAINFARHEALQAQAPYVEPEHIFAGLLTDPATTSARLLRQVSSATLNLETNEHPPTTHVNIKLSPQSKFVVELALQIVRLQGKQSIGTEHLLWGLMRLLETGQFTFPEPMQQYEIDVDTLNRQLAEAV